MARVLDGGTPALRVLPALRGRGHSGGHDAHSRWSKHKKWRRRTPRAAPPATETSPSLLYSTQRHRQHAGEHADGRQSAARTRSGRHARRRPRATRRLEDATPQQQQQQQQQQHHHHRRHQWHQQHQQLRRHRHRRRRRRRRHHLCQRLQRPPPPPMPTRTFATTTTRELGTRAGAGRAASRTGGAATASDPARIPGPAPRAAATAQHSTRRVSSSVAEDRVAHPPTKRSQPVLPEAGVHNAAASRRSRWLVQRGGRTYMARHRRSTSHHCGSSTTKSRAGRHGQVL